MLKEKIKTLSTNLRKVKKRIVSLNSQKTKSNANKRNLLIHQMMKKNRQKKNKKPKTDTSSDESEEEEEEEEEEDT